MFVAAAACLVLRAVVGAPSLVVFGDSLSDDGSGSHEIVRSFFARRDAVMPWMPWIRGRTIWFRILYPHQWPCGPAINSCHATA